MGLFICLEISPVLIKLISSVGPYDWLLDKNENDVKVYAKEKIEKANISTEYRVNELKESLYPKNTSTFKNNRTFIRMSGFILVTFWLCLKPAKDSFE